MPPRKRSRRSFSPEWEQYYNLSRNGPSTRRHEAGIAAAFRSLALVISSRVGNERHLVHYLELSEKAPDVARCALYLLRALDLAGHDDDPEIRRWAREQHRGLHKLLRLLERRKSLVKEK
ncbi:MAG: hypothetical protein ACE5K9_01790 [Candidatus Methylomirabilales bacterium]